MNFAALSNMKFAAIFIIALLMAATTACAENRSMQDSQPTPTDMVSNNNKKSVHVTVELQNALPLVMAESMCLKKMWIKSYRAAAVCVHPMADGDAMRHVKVDGTEDADHVVLAHLSFDLESVDEGHVEDHRRHRKLEVGGSFLGNADLVRVFETKLCANLCRKCPFESFRHVKGCAMVLTEG